MLALVTLVFKLELVRKKSAKVQCISEFLLPPANKSLRIRIETPIQVDVLDRGSASSRRRSVKESFVHRFWLF